MVDVDLVASCGHRRLDESQDVHTRIGESASRHFFASFEKVDRELSPGLQQSGPAQFLEKLVDFGGHLPALRQPAWYSSDELPGD